MTTAPNPYDPFKIVLATHNQHKVKEILSVFQDAPIEFLTLDDFPGAPEVVEDLPTLEGNAQKKAYAIAQFTKHIALSDDSGLEIDFLDGAPGVISARFAGPNCTFTDNCEKVLKLLKGVPSEHRKARFRTVICLALPGGAMKCVEGALTGYITDRMRGENGFGYDPIFLVPEEGKTLAEISPTQKNAISHRSRALMAMRPTLLKLREGIFDHFDPSKKPSAPPSITAG